MQKIHIAAKFISLFVLINLVAYGVGIRHLQLFCMWLCMTALMMARGSIAVAVLAMSEEKNDGTPDIEVYDWDKKTQSVILSSFFWGYVLMQIPSGILVKKYGGKPILLTSLLITATLCFLTPTLAALGGWQLVCASRGFMGLGQAILFPTCQTMIGQWVPPNELTKATGIVYGGSQIATILILPLSGFLSRTALGWKMIFYTIAGILFITAVIWYALAGSTPRSHRMIGVEERAYIESQLNIQESGTTQQIPWKAILTSKGFWGVLAPQCGSSMSFNLFFVDLPTFFEKGMGISFENSASLSALPYIGSWIGATAAPIIAQKLINMKVTSVVVSRKVFGSLAMYGTALGLIILSFVDAEHKTIAIGTIIGIMTIGGNANAGHLVNQLDLSPNFAGVIMSLSNFIANIGNIMVPIVTGIVLRDNPADVSRWRIVFLLHAGNTIICNTIFLVLGTSDRQEWDDGGYLQRKIANPEEIIVLHTETKELDKEESIYEQRS